MKKLDKIIDEIGEIPFSVFYNKFLEANNGNYCKRNAQGIWLSMKQEEREEAFTVISQLPNVRGMHPDYFLKLFTN